MASDRWCRLRKIRVHAEIAPFAFCHHWTKKSPILPNLEEKGSELCMDTQLELGRELAAIEN